MGLTAVMVFCCTVKIPEGSAFHLSSAQTENKNVHESHALLRRADLWPPRINITWRWSVNHKRDCPLRAALKGGLRQLGILCIAQHTGSWTSLS